MRSWKAAQGHIQVCPLQSFSWLWQWPLRRALKDEPTSTSVVRMTFYYSLLQGFGKLENVVNFFIGLNQSDWLKMLGVLGEIAWTSRSNLKVSHLTPPELLKSKNLLEIWHWHFRHAQKLTRRPWHSRLGARFTVPIETLSRSLCNITRRNFSIIWYSLGAYDWDQNWSWWNKVK